MEAYFDNSATTRCFDEVKDIVCKTMTGDFGNPSAMHKKGMEAENYVRKSAQTLAKLLKVNEKEILFTSGGTESDNLAIIGGVEANKRMGNHIITTAVEHAAVAQPFAYLKDQGYEVTILPVDHQGVVKLEALEAALRPDTILVSVMYVNNEVGAVMPVEEIGKLVHEKSPKALFHVDAIQAFGKYRIYPKKLGIEATPKNLNDLKLQKANEARLAAEQLAAAKELAAQAREELTREGLAFNPQVPLGMMIEVPAAAVLADIFAQETDFFSIGTNDLIQYTVAVDRGNKQIEKLYDYHHPAVLRLIAHTIASAAAAGIPCCMCGEAAGEEDFTQALLGCGLMQFSVSAGAVAGLKKRICDSSREAAKSLFAQLEAMKTAEEITRKLSQRGEDA